MTWPPSPLSPTLSCKPASTRMRSRFTISTPTACSPKIRPGLKNLHSVIGHVRDNPASLEKLLDLFQKAGESTHITEVVEFAGSRFGPVRRSSPRRDLYQKLANHGAWQSPAHEQLPAGGQPARWTFRRQTDFRRRSRRHRRQLEATAPSVHQHYPDAVASCHSLRPY